MIYGASSTRYESTVECSKKNGKITSYSAKGANAFNLLTNGNLETDSGWTGSTSGVRYSSRYSNMDGFLGAQSLKLISTSAISGYAERTGTVTIPYAGTYTFSAYVKVGNIAALSGGGGRALFPGVFGE